MTILDIHLHDREVMRWGRNFDKDMNPLEETEFLFIKDMETGHIQAILDGDWGQSSLYDKVFHTELLLRELGQVKQDGTD
ncbi:MAG: hypothetical protein ACXABY_21625, partial [Candidatus Thorarchaeota archaeon]|jgi:hypothetical protein